MSKRKEKILEVTGSMFPEQFEKSRQEVSDCGLNANESQKILEHTECKGHIRILFGEYMGEADMLFTVGKEQFYEIFQNLCK